MAVSAVSRAKRRLFSGASSAAILRTASSRRVPAALVVRRAARRACPLRASLAWASGSRPCASSRSRAARSSLGPAAPRRRCSSPSRPSLWRRACSRGAAGGRRWRTCSARTSSSADGASGGGSIAGPFADNDACVFGGVAMPAKVVSSALVACETLSQGAESPTRTHTRTTAREPGDAFAGAAGPSAVSVFERASHSTRDSSDVTTSYEADASADAAPSLWFVTVPRRARRTWTSKAAGATAGRSRASRRL